MPVTWDAVNEAKLMAAIFMICDVKVSAPQLKELAVIMGSDCTPKAISHRLTKLRKAGIANGSAEAKDDDEPKLKKTKTAPFSTKKAVRQTTTKRAITPVESDDDENGAQLTPPTTVDRSQRNRSFKRSYDETSIIKEEVLDENDDDDDGITVGEDIGQGELF